MLKSNTTNLVQQQTRLNYAAISTYKLIIIFQLFLGNLLQYQG
jgi:hypothetical protein